jgi:hypothetical protein
MMTFYRALLLVTIAPLWGQSIKRLSPSAFPELPSAVRRALNLRGCSVPQSFLTGPHNVIKGEFARPGQTDWAVLCSVNGVSGILVFWNGSPDRPAAIAPQPDANSVQGITDTVTRVLARDYCRRQEIYHATLPWVRRPQAAADESPRD